MDDTGGPENDIRSAVSIPSDLGLAVNNISNAAV